MSTKYIRRMLKEAIASDIDAPEAIETALERDRGCVITASTLPDDFLAIFFGDQLIGATPQSVTFDGKKGLAKLTVPHVKNDLFLKKAGLTKDKPITRKINKLNPEVAKIVRKRLAQAVESPLIGSPFFAETICNTLTAVFEFIESQMTAIAMIMGTYVSKEVVSDVDISGEINKTYRAVGEFYKRKFGAGLANTENQDFVFFPNVFRAFANGQQPTEKILKKDVKIIEKRLTNFSKLKDSSALFSDFVNIAFWDYDQKSSVEATRVAAQHISDATEKLANYKQGNLSQIVSEDYKSRALKQSERLSTILRATPNSQKLLVILNDSASGW